MKITFKLFASLSDYLPQQARYTNVIELDIAQDATILQVIEPFALPKKWCIWCWSTAPILPPSSV